MDSKTVAKLNHETKRVDYIHACLPGDIIKGTEQILWEGEYGGERDKRFMKEYTKLTKKKNWELEQYIYCINKASAYNNACKYW